jgi:hypothetical protein
MEVLLKPESLLVHKGLIDPESAKHHNRIHEHWRTENQFVSKETFKQRLEDKPQELRAQGEIWDRHNDAKLA